jgi:Family of unknown function (DUF6519)
MKGDFSRDSYNRAQHFSRVLMQQGRVQLDADWNEQTDILLHYMRTLAADLIGPFAGPKGAHGFEISNVSESGFAIGTGRYYVDGLLCENEPRKGREVTYANQDNFPNPPRLLTGLSYLVYLDVWERHITSMEVDEIREKALGGPDTATRAQIVWQVKVRGVQNGTPENLAPSRIIDEWATWVETLRPPRRGCLKAKVKRSEESINPCLIAPDSRYRGTENQLYRVEIHSPGPHGQATFKWSRDNGATASECSLIDTELILTHPSGFAANQWVELTNSEQELHGKPGTLVKVTKVEADRLIIGSPVAKPAGLGEEDWPTKVRRWDHLESEYQVSKGGAIPLVESSSNWLELEDGIQIQFLPSEDDNQYQTGDYWLIPARVATGDIEWPNDVLVVDEGAPIAMPPEGISHHYAPLATLEFIKAEGNKWKINDCRCDFPALNACGIKSYGEDGMGRVQDCNTPTSTLADGLSSSLREDTGIKVPSAGSKTKSEKSRSRVGGR